ncbi:DUF1674 domain-containing protein [Curvivirga aplysinae]|uniref:DUF1674 domain-containing protein n=1 Tax=Curvivirga aplysinae TaxID=2529852 RepID=UPI001F3CECDB|nr:succinate dehydrogenase assembly factor 4 [Curvivirga aplysinae]
MEKLKNLFKSSKAPVEKQASPTMTSGDDEPIMDPEVKGHDSKTLAELKADEAGRRWRKMAEENGEVEIEIGGPKGLEPTRYGDWEKAGRCIDF